MKDTLSMKMFILCISCSNNSKHINQFYHYESDTLDLSDITELDYNYYEQNIEPIIKKHLNHNPNAVKELGDLTFMTEYINKVPYKFAFSYMPVINQRLSDLLRERFEFINNCALETPVKQMTDDILLIHGCQAHDCYNVRYDIFINHHDNNIVTVLYDYSTIYCYSENGEVGFEFCIWLVDYLYYTNLKKRIGTYEKKPIIITK